MADQVPPKKGWEFTTYIALRSQADTKSFQANPTLAAGDVKVAIDDGAPANLATLPVVDADFTKRVKVVLSGAEMSGDTISVIFSDAAGAQWCDEKLTIHTTPGVTLDEFYRALVMNRSTIATLASQKKFTLGGGSADDDAYNGMMCYVHDATAAVQRCVGVVWDYVGATKEITLYENPGVFTMAVGDLVVLLPAPPNITRYLYEGSILHHTTVATVASQLQGTLTAGSAVDNAYNSCAILFVDNGDNAIRGASIIDTYVGATKTYTLRDVPTGITVGVGDTAYILPIRLDRVADLIIMRPTANFEALVDVNPKCLGGAIIKATHRVYDNAGVLTVRNAANTADLFTQNITTDAANLPIDALGGATG